MHLCLKLPLAETQFLFTILFGERFVVMLTNFYSCTLIGFLLPEYQTYIKILPAAVLMVAFTALSTSFSYIYQRFSASFSYMLVHTGLQSDHTVHLVRSAPASSAAVVDAAGGASTNAPAPAGGGTPAANPAGLGGMNDLGSFSFPGLVGSGGVLGTGFPEFQQVQQQMMQNPNLMREMMNMPAVQSLMNNPDLMRNLIMSNPQMRDIIDRNPDLGHILNDPSTLRQTLDAARNPELMREMMRNTDRAMSNIEASPEGFNMLRRMYETVEEPFLNAATVGADGGNDLASNPFAALLGAQGLGQTQAQTPSIGAATTTPGSGVAAPNTAPLPNPWDPTRKL